jgi:Ca-activated chloride channel family protein
VNTLALQFLAADHLWLFVLVAAFAAAYVVLQQRRRHVPVRYPNLPLLAAVAPRRPGWRRHVVAAALLIAMSALVLSLARPARSEQVPRDEAIVVLAIDVSGSMTATDIKPNRLQAAIAAARDFVSEAPEAYQIGLVAFDDSAHLMVAPTTDRAALSAALGRLRRGPGTAAGEGVYTALDAIDATAAKDQLGSLDSAGRPFATVVLLADGASTVGRSVQSAAGAAADAKVPVSTIAFGTDHGRARVSGRLVPVPVDDAALRQVATTTGGRFYRAASSEQLRQVYDDIGTRVGHITRQHELVLPLAAIAALTLAAAAGAAMFWSPRFY